MRRWVDDGSLRAEDVGEQRQLHLAVAVAAHAVTLSRRVACNYLSRDPALLLANQAEAERRVGGLAAATRRHAKVVCDDANAGSLEARAVGLHVDTLLTTEFLE